MILCSDRRRLIAIRVSRQSASYARMSPGNGQEIFSPHRFAAGKPAHGVIDAGIVSYSDFSSTATSLRMATKKKPSVNIRPGAGRPTREQAEQRHEELLDQALQLFLEKGFELVTIDAIAASVGMTKRTMYARYADKSALFKAAVQRAIDGWIVPLDKLKAAESDDLEATLTAVARIRMSNAISPAGLRLQRIINAESYRFPEIYTLAYEQGMQPALEFLADLLRRHTKLGSIKITKPEIAAGSFLSMVIGGPTRSIVLGGKVDERALEERIRFCVRLFLDGARPR
jgi:TetR/AcrR family transcriptional regulator, mexJK operon transcriptional repressor